MKRREAVIRLGSLILLVPASRLVSACSSNNNQPAPSPTATTPSTNFVAFTSSVIESHSHTVQIEVSSFQSPPAGGVAKDTSSVVDPVNGVDHFHSVALSETELNNIEAGQTVVKETTVSQSHTHMFSFRLAGTTPSPNPTPSPY